MATTSFLSLLTSVFKLVTWSKFLDKTATSLAGYGDYMYNWEELYKSGNLKKLKVAELNKYIFRHNLSRRKMSKSEKLNLLSAHISKGLCERILTLSAAETAATEDLDTQSEDDDFSVSEDSESEDELLLEFGDASNSDKNDSKDSESEEEDKLPEGARVNRYGRKVRRQLEVALFWDF